MCVGSRVLYYARVQHEEKNLGPDLKWVAACGANLQSDLLSLN